MPAAMLPWAALALSSAPHPTLPTMWKATVNEAQVGVVHESEYFVDRSSKTNPSAKWTNYTDGSCQRLIFEASSYDVTRYLLGCDAVPCCKEDGTSGPMEYQISDVHPASLAPVRNLGNSSIKLFNGDTVTATAYSWKFVIKNTTAYVTMAPNAQTATLHRWDVSIEGDTYTDEYVNYTAIPAEEAASFARNFRVPEVCKGNILDCSDAHAGGKLTDRSIALLRAGGSRHRQN